MAIPISMIIMGLASIIYLYLLLSLILFSGGANDFIALVVLTGDVGQGPSSFANSTPSYNGKLNSRPESRDVVNLTNINFGLWEACFVQAISGTAQGPDNITCFHPSIGYTVTIDIESITNPSTTAATLPSPCTSTPTNPTSTPSPSSTGIPNPLTLVQPSSTNPLFSAALAGGAVILSLFSIKSPKHSIVVGVAMFLTVIAGVTQYSMYSSVYKTASLIGKQVKIDLGLGFYLNWVVFFVLGFGLLYAQCEPEKPNSDVKAAD